METNGSFHRYGVKMAKNKKTDGLNMLDIATKLKMLRAGSGKTQVQVAAALGISQQMYSKYEQAAAPIDSNTIIMICELYGISADYILGIDAPVAASKARQTSIVISDEQLDTIAELLLEKTKNNKK